jgi:diketogulonate reductase-like aldo/keto reductase
MQTVRLYNNVKIPQLGIGVFQAKQGSETEDAVLWALEAGYRHIDTAAIYGNERSVGKAIRKSGIPREEIFVTGKVWNTDIRAGRTMDAFKRTLYELDLDYIDLYLIHWPTEGKEEAWNVLENLYQQKLIRAIGVSNFQVSHLNELMKNATIKPMLNQIESHPLMNNQKLIEYCQSNNIAVGVWSPLGGPQIPLLKHPVLEMLADKYQRTPAQIVLRWDIQRGVIPIPKSTHHDRIVSNSQIFDFELLPEDMLLIQNLNSNFRVGPDPDNFDF